MPIPRTRRRRGLDSPAANGLSLSHSLFLLLVVGLSINLLKLCHLHHHRLELFDSDGFEAFHLVHGGFFVLGLDPPSQDRERGPVASSFACASAKTASSCSRNSDANLFATTNRASSAKIANVDPLRPPLPVPRPRP